MIDFLLNFLGSGIGLIGDFFAHLINLLAKPLSYLLDFLEGIFYFIYQLFMIVVKIIMIFVALFQFFFALVAGFMRTCYSMITVDFARTPLHYPSASMLGIQAVIDQLQPTGILTVVPLVILALIWAMFVKKIIGLLGGDIINNA